MGIDPRWKYSGDELRDVVKGYFGKKIQVSSTRSVYPFVGLKIYPSMGFYGFDERNDIVLDGEKGSYQFYDPRDSRIPNRSWVYPRAAWKIAPD